MRWRTRTQRLSAISPSPLKLTRPVTCPALKSWQECPRLRKSRPPVIYAREVGFSQPIPSSTIGILSLVTRQFLQSFIFSFVRRFSDTPGAPVDTGARTEPTAVLPGFERQLIPLAGPIAGGAGVSGPTAFEGPSGGAPCATPPPPGRSPGPSAKGSHAVDGAARESRSDRVPRIGRSTCRLSSLRC